MNSAREEVVVPAWVAEQFDHERTVPLWNGREVSMDVTQDWLAAYVEELRERRESLFSASRSHSSTSPTNRVTRLLC